MFVDSSSLVLATLLSCAFATPAFFYTVYPDKGPLEGGTLITINASIEAGMNPTRLLLYNNDQLVLQLPLLHVDLERGILTTRTSLLTTRSLAGLPLEVAVELNDVSGNSTTIRTGFTFTFVAGPTITAISPHQYVYSGGTLLTVHGSNLNVSVSPRLLVTTNTLTREETVDYEAPCDVINSTRLLCVLPPLSLPRAIRLHLDSFNPLPDALANLTAVPPSSDIDSQVEVVVGFKFNNSDKYVSLIDVLPTQTMSVVPPPVISRSSVITVSRWLITNITITGWELRRGCDVADYTVYVDSLECTVLQLSDTALTVQIPLLVNIAINQSFSSRRCHGNNLDLTVSVGLREYLAGCVHVVSPCDSRPCLNSGTCVDFASYFECRCTPQFYGRHCQFDNLVITSVWPTHGPLGGGTAITVTGTIPDNFKPIGLYIGNDRFANVTYRTSVLFVVVSPASESPDSNLTLVVNYKWTTSGQVNIRNISADAQFSYRPDPDVTEVHPLQHLYTGGTMMYVDGDFMDSVARPTLNIVMHAQVDHVAITTVYRTKPDACKPQSNSRVECVVPAVRIPLQLRPSLDTDVYTASPSYGQPFQHTALLSNETRTCLHASATSAPADRSPPTIEFGLTFDGVTRYSEYGRLMLYAPPRLCFNDTFVTFKVLVGAPIYVEGAHLLRGCTWRGYVVMIEDVECQVVGLDNNTLWCLPAFNQTPSVNYTGSPSWPCPPDYEYHIVVYVGYERYEVGCVHYDTTSTDFCSVVTCVNNGTCVNKPTTHVCLCTPQFYGDFCQWEAPLLSTLFPSYGVEAGGTSVIIRGTFGSRIRPVAVYFGGYPTTVDNITAVDMTHVPDESAIITRTPMFSESNDTTRLVNVTVEFNDSSNKWLVAEKFLYRPNPRFSSVHPRDQLRTGGTYITLTGSDLDVAQHPMFTVIVIVQRHLRGDQLIYNDILAHTYDCDVKSSRVMRCKMPFCTVPEDFEHFLDVTAIDTTQMRYVSRDVMTSFTDDATSAQHQQTTVVGDVSITNSDGHVMRTYVSMKFDNLELNVSTQLHNATLRLHNNPVVKPLSQVVKIYANTSQIIQIEGVNLTIGCAQDDYTVYIDDTVCDLVVVFYDRLQFFPPDEPPAVNATSVFDFDCEPEDDDITSYIYHVRVRIGDTMYGAGCVRYASYVDEQLYIDELVAQLITYVLVAVFSGVIIALIIAICTKH